MRFFFHERNDLTAKYKHIFSDKDIEVGGKECQHIRWEINNC